MFRGCTIRFSADSAMTRMRTRQQDAEMRAHGEEVALKHLWLPHAHVVHSRGFGAVFSAPLPIYAGLRELKPHRSAPLGGVQLFFLCVHSGALPVPSAHNLPSVSALDGDTSGKTDELFSIRESRFL